MIRPISLMIKFKGLFVPILRACDTTEYKRDGFSGALGGARETH